MSTEEAQINEDETDFENLEEHVQASKIITKYLLVEIRCENVHYNMYIDLNKKSEFIVIIPNENKTVFQGYPN